MTQVNTAQTQLPPLVDADVLLGHYPFRRFPYPHMEPGPMRAYLQARGIAQACVSSLHALFYTDPQQGNDECLPALTGDPFFIPVAVVNPTLPNWRRGLRRARERDGARMVRLAPSYHTFDLASPLGLECVRELVAEGYGVSIVKRIEDERMHHPLMKVPAVENRGLLAVAEAVDAPLLVHGAYFGELAELAAAPNLLFDLAFVETIDTLAATTALLAPARLCFSSHAPFFYPEAAISKLQNWQADPAARRQVAGENLLARLGLAAVDTAAPDRTPHTHA